MILLKANYDSGLNEVLYVKIDGRVQELWLDTSFGPKGPKCSFLAPDPKVNFFLRHHDFNGFIL